MRINQRQSIVNRLTLVVQRIHNPVVNRQILQPCLLKCFVYTRLTLVKRLHLPANTSGMQCLATLSLAGKQQASRSVIGQPPPKKIIGI